MKSSKRATKCTVSVVFVKLLTLPRYSGCASALVSWNAHSAIVYQAAGRGKKGSRKVWDHVLSKQCHRVQQLQGKKCYFDLIFGLGEPFLVVWRFWMCFMLGNDFWNWVLQKKGGWVLGRSILQICLYCQLQAEALKALLLISDFWLVCFFSY